MVSTLCGPGLIPGSSMWEGGDRPSRVGGFLWVVQFPPPRWIAICQHLSLLSAIGLGQMSFLYNGNKIDKVDT